MAKPLSILDSGWLMMETSETPMHVGGLQLYELPDDAGPDYVESVYRFLVDVDEVAPPFNLKLHSRLPGAVGASWVEDDALDIEYHVRHSALPYPGRVRELLALTSRLHSHRLDRARPMWECHVIEGVEGNRFAVYIKMHHSLVDGVAGSRLLQARMSTSAAEHRAPPWSTHWLEDKPKRSVPARVVSSSMVTAPVRAALALGRGVREVGSMMTLPRSGNATTIYRAPKTQLNGRVTGARRFAADSWSLSLIRDVAKRHGATVNDVFLLMCAGSLREYLISQDALPEEPLVAQVPVSLRAADQADDGGNAISAVQVSLGTHLADPIERLAAIRESMGAARTRLGAMASDEILAFTALTNIPLSVGQITGISGRINPLFNLVISNVPGPKEARYLLGAKMVANYPVSLVWHGYAVNITVQSYLDNLDVGIIACRNRVPHVQRMLDHLENALVELEEAG